MATLVFTTIGTAIGGPLGGMVGGLVGRQLDTAIFGGSNRRGPRLDDLKVTTSSYGSAIARHYGTIRAPGTVIWASDLAEHSDTQGGGKGSPSITTYSYTISFAVALASRPIMDLGRIWADGNLLRGAAGDLKAGGSLRLYTGHGDHAPDPLMASAEGAYCPAYRGTAYVVFEDLDLTDFGNRIPALTFEIIADDGEVTLARMLEDVSGPVTAARPLAALAGFSSEGGPIAQTLATIDAVYPLACDAGSEQLTLLAADAVPAEVPLLPEAAITVEEGGFGAHDGRRRRRNAASRDIPSVLRYYDQDRDYLAGVQRADGRARPGRDLTIEFPGALAAGNARALVNAAAERASWSGEAMAWRIAELDPALAPGSIVRAAGLSGYWRITAWEWREHGVELELLRLPHGPARQPAADSGLASLPADLTPGPTLLHAFELPWDGLGSNAVPQLYAAASSSGAGWRGAALYLDRDGELVPLGGSGQHRAIVGHCLEPVAPSRALLLDRQDTITLALASGDFALASTTPAALALGANRALIGDELVQFAQATSLGSGQWRLEGLLRGRAGSEAAALAGHAAGTSFTLLDNRLVAIDPLLAVAAPATTLTAIGLGDNEPVTALIANQGMTRKPLTPVHPRSAFAADGSVRFSWTRRARGTWTWMDGVETPLGEESEAYRLGLGPVDNPILHWDLTSPDLTLAPATYADLAASHPGAALWVCQVGSFALSDPLLLHTLP